MPRKLKMLKVFVTEVAVNFKSLKRCLTGGNGIGKGLAIPLRQEICHHYEL